MNINDLMMNQAFCINVNLDDGCHDVFEKTGTYRENFYTFTRNEKDYIVPERDLHGNWTHAIDWARFMELQSIFPDNFMPISALPKESEVI